jgi:surface antigen
MGTRIRRATPALVLLMAALAVTGCQSARSRLSDPIAYAPSSDGTVGLIGSVIGANIDAGDKKIGLDAEYRALEYGENGVGVDWSARGVAGAVVPGPRYRVNDYDCRQFTHTVIVHGTTESARATACRGSDGAWRIVG